MTFKAALRITIPILNPPGGLGKTFLAQVLEAIAKNMLRDILLASQDRGNHALKSALENVGVVPPDVTEADVTRVINRVSHREIFVIDVGANPATDSYNPMPFYVSLSQRMRELGGRFIAVVPTAPLKEGADKATMNTLDSFLNEGIETHLVKNHQNRSGDFGALEIPDGVPVSELPKLDDGLVALLRSRKGSFLDAYHDPEPGYRLAGNRIGQWLSDASNSPLAQTIFGHSGPAFTLSPEERPSRIHTTIETLASVSDDALQLNYDRLEARDAFLSADPGEAFEAAAWRYRELLKR